MERELFVKTINAIQKQSYIDIEISKALSKAFPNAYQANLIPNNRILFNALIKVLEVEMNDNEGWIDHYIYGLDFGRDNDKFQIKDKNDKIIPLSSANELYDLLKGE